MRRVARAVFYATLALALASVDSIAQQVNDQGLSDLQGSPWTFDAPETHGGIRNTINSDFAPVVAPQTMVESFRVLGRRGLIPGILSPHMSLQDNERVLSISSRGLGFRHLHAWDAETGEIVWQSRPWLGRNDHSTPGPLLGPGLLDVDGRWIVVDEDDIFAYDHETGEQLWQTSFSRDDGPWVSYGVFTNAGDVAFFHWRSGLLASYDRVTGELQWTSDVLTGVEPQPCRIPRITTIVGAALLGMDYLTFEEFQCAGLGSGVKITESPSLDTERNQIVYMGSDILDPGQETPDGAVFGIQIVTDENGDEVGAELIWKTKMAPGTGTSATLNLDQDTVLGADGDGFLQGHSLLDGHLVWKDDQVAEGLFSPALTQEKFLLSSDTFNVIAVQDGTGDTIWKESYEFLIPEVLEQGPPMPPFTDGTPSYTILSGMGCTIGGDAYIGVNPLFGYWFDGIIIPTLNPFVQANIRVRERDGKYVEGSLTKFSVKGSSMDVGTVWNDKGFANSSYLELNSVLYNGIYNWFAYRPFYRQRILLPGGVRGLAPGDYAQYSLHQLSQLRDMGDHIIELIEEDKLQPAFNQVRWARRALGVASPLVVEEAAERDLTICEDDVLAEVAAAEGFYAAARASLLGDPSDDDKADAIDAIADGQDKVDDALDILLDKKCVGSGISAVQYCHNGQDRVGSLGELGPHFNHGDTLGACDRGREGSGGSGLEEARGEEILETGFLVPFSTN